MKGLTGYTRTDVVVGGLWLAAFVLLFVGVGLHCFAGVEAGAIWHDGSFAPCAFVLVPCTHDYSWIVFISRNGQGVRNPLTWYLVGEGVGFSLDSQHALDVLIGYRFNLLMEEGFADGAFYQELRDWWTWPLWGVMVSRDSDVGVAKAGGIWTWHGEGWALWPAFFFGFHL